MVVACSCSNPTSGSVSLKYDGADPLVCDPTVAEFYVAGNNVNAFEADFLWGASSFFAVPALAALAQAIQESSIDGHNNNWLQVDPDIAAGFGSAVVDPYNVTGVSYSPGDALIGDSLNAAVAMWYMQQNLAAAKAAGYSLHDQLAGALNKYKGLEAWMWVPEGV